MRTVRTQLLRKVPTHVPVVVILVPTSELFKPLGISQGCHAHHVPVHRCGATATTEAWQGLRELGAVVEGALYDTSATSSETLLSRPPVAPRATSSGDLPSASTISTAAPLRSDTLRRAIIDERRRLRLGSRARTISTNKGVSTSERVALQSRRGRAEIHCAVAGLGVEIKRTARAAPSGSCPCEIRSG